ncbi:hypothetical protein JAAARDRAFT_41229 [Jaapia argillacea MUCL 33604]|uniref:Actin-like ATPase domain-containing protein n=1 Tax=Jaapia argillacea MUCL 33604 TaxID=933084 RepID=A0A067PC13_9AGAM|nr:hypothetical protein JAAARDRAFT_41229 [Jaapia argillacea MUCL 33604]
MAANGAIPNGSADAPIDVSGSPNVVGINFGNSYASIAVLTKEGLSECIANEDGERQIACAISFHGEEIYIGNQAKPQLIKNGHNTIVGFRNLLGKKFSELPKDKPSASALIIQHPDLPDTPAYKVHVLQPAPKPLPPTTSNVNTPSASAMATPRSEPTPAERILTVSEVTTIFLKSLIKSAEDFLGKKVTGAVVSVPAWFDDAQRAALAKAAEDAEFHVLQLLEDSGAIAVTTAYGATPAELSDDRTQLVVDVGQSSLELALLSIRQGLAYSLATSTDFSVGGEQIDDKLIKFFAKDFTKKSKVPLVVCPAKHTDKRAEAKLRLAVEHTKRTLAASPGAATCSVESLKDGFDYTGTINRLRFDMEMKPIYEQIATKVRELVESASLDLYDVDEIVYVGGSASFPGLDDYLGQAFHEGIVTPFTTGTVIGGGVGDPTTILARGCALQAKLLASIGTGEEESKVRQAFEVESEWTKVKATTKTIGILFPEENSDGGLGGQWIPTILMETPLPCRRVHTFEVDLGEGDSKKVGFEVWEVKEGVKIEKVIPPKEEDDPEEVKEDAGDPEEDDDAEEELDVKEKTVEKETFLQSLSLEAKEATKVNGRWKTKLEVQFLVGGDGGLEISAWEIGKDGRGEKTSVSVSA